MENLTQLGVGGILALLILKTVFDFVQQRRTNGNDNSIFHKISDLWEWHKPVSGKFLWYESSEELTEVVKELKQEISALRRDIRSLKP